MSQFYGNILVIAFFIMMSSYGYYQHTYNKKKAKESQKQNELDKTLPQTKPSAGEKKLEAGHPTKIRESCPDFYRRFEKIPMKIGMSVPACNKIGPIMLSVFRIT